MEQKKLQAAIEAILFAMGGSVELKKLAQAIGHDEETTKKVIRQMMDRYEKEDRGIRIIELEASFQMCTKKEMYEYLIRVAKPVSYTHLAFRASSRRDYPSAGNRRSDHASGDSVSEIFRGDDNRRRADDHCEPRAWHSYDQSPFFE